MKMITELRRSRVCALSLVAVILGSAALGGCGLGRSPAIEPIPINGDQLRIVTADASDVGDRVLVYGLVRKRSPIPPRRGHLHVEAQIAGSAEPIWVDTGWTRLDSRWNRLGGPQPRTGRFSATLPIADADRVERITVSYMPQSHGRPS